MDLLTINNMLGGIAFVLTCIALVMLRKQISEGWVVFLPSYLLQIVIFWRTEQVFLIFQMIVLFVLSLMNYFKWEETNGSSRN